MAPASTSSSPAALLREDELRAWAGFLRAHASLMAQLDRELEASHGLPLRSFDVLVQLAQAPDRRLRMSELADAVVLSRSGLTRLVDRLTEQGYVERQRCPSDARGAHAVLTAAGLRRVRRAGPTHVASVRRLFHSRFSDDELRALGEFWERLAGPAGVGGQPQAS